MTRRFTGWHMTAIMCAFFAVVIAVNVLMASDAIRTFGGTVVDNSYVASQNYNRWLAEARVQRLQGWSAEPGKGDGGAVTLALARAGRPIEGAHVTIEASHPLGRVPARKLVLHDRGDGHYASEQALPAGRWLLSIDVRSGGDHARFADEVHS